MTVVPMDAPPTLFFEDLAIGQAIELGSISAGEGDILDFARRFDPQPFHVDARAAAAHPFGGLVASGWHTASLFMRLYVDAVLARSACLGSPGVDELRWRAPVRPGQLLSGRLTVLRAEHSRTRPDRGTVWPLCELLDEGGRVVLSMVLVTLLAARDHGGEATLPRAAQAADGDR